MAGVSDYIGDTIDLRYAAKDFAFALRIAAHRLFGEERVHLTVLTATDGDARPTRKALLAALEGLKQARPRDLLVVYLAGHGVNHGWQEGDFHFLTADAQLADLADPAVRRTVAVSSRELTDLVKELPPRKQVLVLERLKDRTGLFVLAGCASDAVSYEATRRVSSPTRCSSV